MSNKIKMWKAHGVRIPGLITMKKAREMVGSSSWEWVKDRPVIRLVAAPSQERVVFGRHRIGASPNTALMDRYVDAHRGKTNDPLAFEAVELWPKGATR